MSASARRRTVSDPENRRIRRATPDSEGWPSLTRGVGMVVGGIGTVAAIFYLGDETIVDTGNWSLSTVFGRVVVMWGLALLALAVTFGGRTHTPTTLQTEMYASSRGSRDWLLLLRVIAAALVFVMHSGIVLGHDFTQGEARWAWLALSPAWLGMGIFFTLSGFLMGKVIMTGRYQLNRAGVAAFVLAWLGTRRRMSLAR